MNSHFFIILIWTILAKQNNAFQSGFNYIYKYESTFDQISTNISLNYTSKLDVLVQKIDHQIVLKVLSVDGNFGFNDQLVKNLIEFPISFEQEDGYVKNSFFVDENDSQASIWQKKSILSMLDFGKDQGKKVS